MNNDVHVSEKAVSGDWIICEKCTGKNARSGHYDITGWTNLVYDRPQRTSVLIISFHIRFEPRASYEEQLTT